MTVVLKLSGHIFDPDPCAAKIGDYSKVIRAFSKKDRLVIVTGGGSTARKYIVAARELGASEAVCDQIGIYVSRLNARLLAASLGDLAFPDTPECYEDVARLAASGLVVVMGGLQPGQSTNAVAALAAETLRADLFVNATDVDGVYTADPHKDPSAKKLAQVTTEELERILSGEGFRAGEYALMDPVALRVISRSSIPVVIVDGRDPQTVDKALHGERVGTRIITPKR